MHKQEVVKFINGEVEIEVNVSPKEDTVWLSLNQISELFQKNKSTVSRHITNIFKEGELSEIGSVAKNATPLKLYDPRTGDERITPTEITYYNLDVIISVGYRVKSKEGIIFRKWANSILKEYMLKGYVINANKFSLPSFEDVTSLLEQSRKVTGKLQLSSDDMLDFLVAYRKGLKLLDDYDHQKMECDHTLQSIYVLSYDECIDVIKRTSFTEKGDLFGLEKSDEFKSALATIYQTFAGVDFYPTLEDKASNLLYLITKNHAFADGNKRIAATIFLYFLEKNNALYRNGKQVISNTTLATLTILVASSNPNDKESMIHLVKLLITMDV